MSLQDTANSPTPDNLFAGTQVQPVVADEVIIATAAGAVTRGTVLGKITATGLYVPVDSGATNGSETAVAVLAEDTDATDDDKPAPGYFTGEYNENALTFGGTDTAEDHRDALAARGIFLKSNVPA